MVGVPVCDRMSNEHVLKLAIRFFPALFSRFASEFVFKVLKKVQVLDEYTSVSIKSALPMTRHWTMHCDANHG